MHTMRQVGDLLDAAWDQPGLCMAVPGDGELSSARRAGIVQFAKQYMQRVEPWRRPCFSVHIVDTARSGC